MIIKGKRAHLRTAIAIFMLFAGILGGASLARAYVTVEVYVAWDSAAFEFLPNSDTGGLTRVDGDYAFTLPGVCGMQFKNIAAWHWSGPNGPLANLPSNGDPIPNNYNFQYTGPYSGCENNILMFTTPASPSGEFPEGAERLVVQVDDMSDVYYLNASYNAIPEPEWPEIHEHKSICEMFPDACEGGKMTICLQLFQPEDCESEEHALPLGFASELAGRTDQELNGALAAARKTVPVQAEIDRALTTAQIHAMHAARYLKRASGADSHVSTIHRQMSELAINQCNSAIAKARAVSSKPKQAS